MIGQPAKAWGATALNVLSTPLFPFNRRIETYIARVEVHPQRLIIRFALAERAANDQAENAQSIPWQKTASTGRRAILPPEGAAAENTRRIRSEDRTTLLASIGRGRRWLEELVIDPTATAETIAKREGCTARKVTMTISLAFLAPDLVKAAIDNTLPHGMGVVRLADLQAEWSKQHQVLVFLGFKKKISNRVSAKTGLRFPGNANFRARDKAAKSR